MTQDIYREEVLSGRTQVEKVLETEHVLAYYPTRPFWDVQGVDELGEYQDSKHLHWHVLSGRERGGNE